MQARSRLPDTDSTDSAQSGAHRLQFVLKRPDGICKPCDGRVKYVNEDEIVDDAGQRGGLRKTKVCVFRLCIGQAITFNRQGGKRYQIRSLYDFEDGVDPYLLDAQRALAVATNPVGHRSSTAKPKSRLGVNRLSLSGTTTLDAPRRPKTVSFKDDIIPASNSIFTLKRKNKELSEREDRVRRKRDDSHLPLPAKPALTLVPVLNLRPVVPAPESRTAASGDMSEKPFYVAPTPPPLATASRAQPPQVQSDFFLIPATAPDEGASPASQ